MNLPSDVVAALDLPEGVLDKALRGEGPALWCLAEALDDLAVFGPEEVQARAKAAAEKAREALGL